ncbi:hypothetical protein GALMADRAFT_213254 [Galerina marginata CBS 339.88]|uniref:F-box domain-containing protein n=1 Tax=Galerina marginata (strain CBS 339.88) TaxID=685588 RepID=A0A067SZI9_GALM3|nr:hypothetical protein GALMADRAFT_213254 [Galerina marginata CBS 339.88]
MGNSVSLPSEVLFNGIKHMDFEKLRTLAVVNRQLRPLVKTVLRLRVYGGLKPFMSESKIVSFLSTLAKTDSVVGGSVAQGIITPSIFYNSSPRNLNIFVPEDHAERWEDYLEEEFGYLADRREAHWSRTVKTLTFMFLKEDCLEGYVRDGALGIVICESYGSSCLVPILASPFTSQMNFLTESYIYCLHPRLTPNLMTVEVPAPSGNETLEDAQDEYKELLRTRGLEVLDENAQDVLCGEGAFCLGLLRFFGMKIIGREKCAGDAVSMVYWNEDGDMDDFLGQKGVRFWMGGRPEGVNCEHKAHASRLLKFS